MRLDLTSPAFRDGGTIPTKFTCDGADVSPPLDWSRAPEGTKSLALICDDPDAPMGTWVHWVLYGIPADKNSLREGVPRNAAVEGIGMQGKNDFRRIGYGGPCPPPGKPHRYFFKLYALDAELELKPDAKKVDLERAMRGHLLATGQLVGRYQR
jgi:Raf kinase inhibitor-like YbhB/YbcL family protein